MKRIIAVFLSLSLLFVFAGCGKSDNVPTTTTPYIDSGVNNSYDNNYVDNSDIYATNVNSDIITNVAPQPTVTQNVQNTTESSGVGDSENSTTVQEKPTEAPTTSAPKGLMPDSVESNSGIEKATYGTSDRTYIVYYMSELLTHDSKFPIISWANGTGCPPSLYDGLLRELASAGFIVIASDETMAADGTVQIAQIDFVIDENSNKSSALYKKVNTSRIGVIGHSQGGRSAVNAGAMDDRIACVLSLAGSNYVEEAEKLSKPVLFMAGTKDKVVDADRWLVTAFDAVKGPAVYASLNGAIHTTCCSNPTAYSRYIISWFNGWFYNDNNYKDMFKDGGELSQDSAWTGFMCKGF
ncbi:MAG: hypothetical protein E7522_06390 [Ruminococcaceae bacterium]|nr:hypothetical protein [Oscillospiraceae bacterium]